MSVKWKTTKNKFPDMYANVQAMNGQKIKIGALKGEHAWLASIHEYGVNITPKKAQYLTVPVSPKSKGKKASEFSDLWTLRAKSGELFLCRDTGKDNFEVLYWLARSVKIPERSFLRSTHDEKADEILKRTNELINQVIEGKLSPNDLLDNCGKDFVSAIKDKIRNIKSPDNSWSTKETKGSSNPLIDTGGLLESITWQKG